MHRHPLYHVETELDLPLSRPSSFRTPVPLFPVLSNACWSLDVEAMNECSGSANCCNTQMGREVLSVFADLGRAGSPGVAGL